MRLRTLLRSATAAEQGIYKYKVSVWYLGAWVLQVVLRAGVSRGQRARVTAQTYPLY